MKQVYPVGRSLEMGAKGDATPQACMCNKHFGFAVVLGPRDNCKNCGCGCTPLVYNANSSIAYGTPRASV